MTTEKPRHADTVVAFGAAPIGSLWVDTAGKLVSEGGLMMVVGHDTDPWDVRDLDTCFTVEWDDTGVHDSCVYVSTLLRYMTRLC